MQDQNEDPIPFLVKNSEDLIKAVNYLIMRVNRIEDRLNIGIDDKEEKK